MWLIPRALSESFRCAREAADWSEASSSLLAAVLSRSWRWRSRPSPPSTWLKRWKRVGWLQRLSSRTYVSHRPECSEDYGSWLESVSSLLLPASHASPTAPQESVSTPKTSAGSGPPSRIGFARYDPGSSSWRTSPGSPPDPRSLSGWLRSIGLDDKDLSQVYTLRRHWSRSRQEATYVAVARLSDTYPDMRTCLGPWPKAVIGSAESLCELPRREPRNGVSGSSWSEFYPTPSATACGSSQNEGQVPHDRPGRGTPSLSTWALSDAAQDWPTPTSAEKGSATMPRGNPTLKGAALDWPKFPNGENWSTPTASDHRPTKPENPERPGLIRWDAEQLFPHSHPALETGADGPPSSPPGDGTSSPRSPSTKSGNWPTPVADSKGPSSKTGDGAQGGPQLGQVATEWATPTTIDYKNDRGRHRKHSKGGRSLPADLAGWKDAWPTPDREDWEKNTLPGQIKTGKRHLGVRFVAWLQGWLTPSDLRCSSVTELTDSACSETESSRSRPRSRSES